MSMIYPTSVRSGRATKVQPVSFDPSEPENPERFIVQQQQLSKEQRIIGNKLDTMLPKINVNLTPKTPVNEYVENRAPRPATPFIPDTTDVISIKRATSTKIVTNHKLADLFVTTKTADRKRMMNRFGSSVQDIHNDENVKHVANAREYAFGQLTQKQQFPRWSSYNYKLLNSTGALDEGAKAPYRLYGVIYEGERHGKVYSMSSSQRLGNVADLTSGLQTSDL